MEVRRVRPEEYEEVGEIGVAAYAEFGPSTSSADRVRENADWEAYNAWQRRVAFRDDVAEVWVAVDGGRILGSVTIETDARASETAPPLEPGEAYIRMLGVAPEGRGRGAGRALMAKAIERARDEGKTFITLNSTVQMKTAQELYEAMGFVQQPDTVMDDGFRLLTYRLELPDG